MEKLHLQECQSKEISFVVWVRAISVILILLCHLAQTHANAYVVISSQFFNVGVNIFIIISGYLFGKLGIETSYRRWLLKRLKRIYIPYWFFLFIIIILQVIRGLEINLSSIIYSILGLHGFKYTFPGSQHTWFITAILLCYLITPMLDTVVTYLLQRKHKTGLILFVLLLAIAPAGMAFFSDSAILVTCPFYGLAFILGRTWDEDTINLKKVIVTLLTAFFAFLFRFGMRFLIDGTILYNNIVAVYTHYLAGFCFFIAAAYLFNRAPLRIVNFISEISFEIYLYHYMFMRPPLSMMSVTGNWYLNSIIALLFTFLVAWIMCIFGKRVCKILEK